MALRVYDKPGADGEEGQVGREFSSAALVQAGKMKWKDYTSAGTYHVCRASLYDLEAASANEVLVCGEQGVSRMGWRPGLCPLCSSALSTGDAGLQRPAVEHPGEVRFFLFVPQ